MSAEMFDHKLEFGPVTIPPGGRFISVKVTPGCLFRGEGLEVRESIRGATFIVTAFVGQKNQLPLFDEGEYGIGGMPSSAWEKGAGGRGVRFDVCQPMLRIAFWVGSNATEPVTWSATLHGKAAREA